MGDITGLSSEESGVSTYKRIPFGKEMLKQFLIDPKYKNLNHGSFGTIPKAIFTKAASLRAQAEFRPDIFIRYTYPELLDTSRAAAATLLNVPTETLVFIPNATTGVNTVLHNLVWNPDGKDEILHFNIIYGACGKTVEYICESNLDIVSPRLIPLHYPLEDDAVITAFQNGISASLAAGKRPRIAIFDTVASNPGVRLPFERLTSLCAEQKILSLIDGAHGIGHLPLDLSALDPDFFVSNCHKWLFAPRSSAVFYVPLRNQHLIRSTLPTSHGFVPRPGRSSVANPLPGSKKGEFVTNFQFVGTLDNTPYICVGEAIKWRQEVCGGEAAIREYVTRLAKEGGAKVAQILGTEVMDNKTGTITDCCLVNVRLPLAIGTEKETDNKKIEEGGGEGATNVIRPGYGIEAKQWMEKVLTEEYNTFLPVYFFQDTWWTRLSGQIYLDMEDFEWAGARLKELCERVVRGEYLKEELETEKGLEQMKIV